MNKILDLKIESFAGKIYNFNCIGPASVDGRVFEHEGEEKDEDNEDEVLPGDWTRYDQEEATRDG